MYLGRGVNEHGKPVDRFKCDTCGDAFTVCPPASGPDGLAQWQACLSITCASYDPARDADKLFDDGNAMSFAGRKTKVHRGSPPREPHPSKPTAGD